MSEVLVGAIQEEFDHLLERAEKNGAAAEAPALIRKIFDRMAKHASSAMRRRAYRAALEFARGAEALSHIEAADQEVLNQELLTAGVSPKKLRG
jgi:hypothetical protein